jgi:hypothetical protein
MGSIFFLEAGPEFATSPFDLNYRAASGHAAAAPPSSVMNSRRINGSNCIDARQPDPIRAIVLARLRQVAWSQPANQSEFGPDQNAKNSH